MLRLINSSPVNTDYGIVFGKARIKSIAFEGDDTLRIKTAYLFRTQEHRYHNVYYSQLDEGCAGTDIVLAIEHSLEEISVNFHGSMTDRMKRELLQEDMLFVGELIRQGYRLYVHYSTKREGYLIIAKHVTTKNIYFFQRYF